MNRAFSILVVDDDVASRLLVRATLARAGLEIAEAGDGAQALECARVKLPDLVLMDVSMPVMDGFCACEELRKLPGGSRVPVVMMTGLDDVESIERAFEVGASDFLTKPIHWTLLAHRVRYILRASAAINDVEQHRRRLSNAQRIGDMGDWAWNVGKDEVVPSEQAWHILGADAAAEVMRSDVFLASVHPHDASRVRDALNSAIACGTGLAIECRIVRPGGESRHVRQQIEVLERDASGRALQLAGAMHDVTQLKEAEEQIRRLAYFDSLTGLPNRLMFNEQLFKVIANADRWREQAAVLFIDIDHFKRVNDTLGHSAGDELLKMVSTRLSYSLRPLDSVSRAGAEPKAYSIARLGGDEFIVMLSELHDPTDAATVANRLVAALTQPFTIQGTELFVGASIGVALYPGDGADIDTLLKNADTAMYRAKEAGRGGVRFYDASMNARSLERLGTETLLRHALDRNEFVLHFQPRIALTSGRIVGAEALMRWQHPQRGLLPPSEFIALAEEARLIIPMGEWAIAEVCRCSAAWRRAGLNPGRLAVNLSASHLRERGLPDQVAALLQQHAMPADGLEIEVTESMLMDDPELSVETARRLNAIGVRLAIDDFGTGYSSLSYLKRLPISALKIDQSFVRDLATDPDDAAIITAIIAMAHTLKLTVVAEGVETQAQHDFLAGHGCDEFQGYLASPPVDVAEFARLLARQDAHAGLALSA